MKIQLNEQKAIGNYKFDGMPVMTRGFQSQFKNLAPIIAKKTLMLIQQRAREIGADYLQVAKFSNTTFWVKDDVDHITFLLPEEY